MTINTVISDFLIHGINGAIPSFRLVARAVPCSSTAESARHNPQNTTKENATREPYPIAWSVARESFNTFREAKIPTTMMKAATGASNAGMSLLSRVDFVFAVNLEKNGNRISVTIRRPSSAATRNITAIA